MSDFRSQEAGASNARHFTLVKRADGSPITGGTVNWYLKNISGAGTQPNAGKWWKDSDQTWQVAETANPMTHQADGNWTRTLAASPWTNGDVSLEYAKESGDLHVPNGRMLKVEYTPQASAARNVTVGTNLDKIDYALTVGEHVNVVADAQLALTQQGYTIARSVQLDNIAVFLPMGISGNIVVMKYAIDYALIMDPETGKIWNSELKFWQTSPNTDVNRTQCALGMTPSDVLQVSLGVIPSELQDNWYLIFGYVMKNNSPSLLDDPMQERCMVMSPKLSLDFAPKGARTVTVTVTDELNDPIEGVVVRFTAVGESYVVESDVNGTASIGLHDGTYKVAASKPGFQHQSFDITVAGDLDVAIDMVAVSIPMPDNPDLVMCYLTTYDGKGDIQGNVTIKFQLQHGPGTAGQSVMSGEFTATSDDVGLLEVELLKNSRYWAWRGSPSHRVSFDTGEASFFALPEILGTP